MQWLLDWLLALGTAGATENARAVINERRTEDFTVRALGRRVAARERRAA